MAGKILTANRLDDGLVIYFTSSSGWTLDLDKALVADTPDKIAHLEQELKLLETSAEVADAYLFDIEYVEGEVRPAHIRERIRTLGPTVRGDLGKQSDSTRRTFAVTA